MTRTVLIFDSSSVTCHTVSQQLRMVGFDTLQARSLAGARLALSARSVDLVILGLAAPALPSSPDTDGMTLLRELRRDRATQHVPVVILTASARHSDRIDARAAGAVAFLTKPVSTRELLVTVNNTLALHAPTAPARGLYAPDSRPVGDVASLRAMPFSGRRNWRPDWAAAPAWSGQ